jgi:hypothetical protein
MKDPSETSWLHSLKRWAKQADMSVRLNQMVPEGDIKSSSSVAYSCSVLFSLLGREYERKTANPVEWYVHCTAYVK